MSPATGLDASLQAILVLAAGVAVVIVAAGLATWRMRSAVWQRTAWEAAILGVLALVVAEAIGLSSGAVALVRLQLAGAVVAPQQRFERSAVPRSESPAIAPPGRATQAGHDVSEGLADRRPRGSLAGRPPEDRPAGAVLDNSREALFPAAVVAPAGALQAAEQVARFTPPIVESPGGEESSPAPGASIGWLVATVWLLGMMALGAWAIRARFLLARFRRHQAPLDNERLERRARQLAACLGLRDRVECLQSDTLAAPVAFGIFRPALVLPARFAEEFEPSQQDAILTHELAHLAARDPLWQLMADAATAILWWHPMMGWLRRQLRAAAEAAADEACLLLPEGPDTLAGCLVTIGHRLAGVQRLGWLGMDGSGFRSALGRRVERLLSLTPVQGRLWGRRRPGWAMASLAIGLVLVSISCTAWARARESSKEGVTTMSVLSNSWRHSLAAAVMLAFWAQAPATLSAAEDAPKPPPSARPEPPPPPPPRDREDDRKPEADRPREEGGPEDREHRRPRPDREQLKARLEEIRQAAQKAREAGQREVLERLERQGHELMQMLEEGPPEGRGPSRRPMDVQRRIMHLRAAIENLREAGMDDAAERLTREARELAEQAGDRPPPPQGRWADGPGEGRREGPPHEFDRPMGPPPPPEMERAVRELREQVQLLTRQMEETRVMLKRLEARQHAEQDKK